MNSTVRALFAGGILTGAFTLSHITAEPVVTHIPSESSSVMAAAPWFENSDAQWIWPAAAKDAPNQYVQMLQTFELNMESSASVELAISADSNYAVWLNGAFVNFGQWSNLPDDKTYDVLNLNAQTTSGLNRLAIVVYHQGQSSSTYRKGEPGAIFAIRANSETVAVSGESTQMRRSPDYISGPVPHVTGQLGFAFEHRGDREDDWIKSKNYSVSTDWASPTKEEMKPISTRPVRVRPIPKLRLDKRLPMHVVSQGAFTREVPGAEPADSMQSDAMSFIPLPELFHNPQEHLADNSTTGMTVKAGATKGFTGTYIVLDTGREEAGLLELELDTPKGTIVDVGYGEHLEDLRVRTSIGGRNFAVRHVTPEGHHTFMHPFLRLAGRYVQVHIIPPADALEKPVVVSYAGLRPTPYPVERTGSFKSSDSLHDRIWEVSRHTLELCMHEHYEDCPWREQALYGMDARNQALAGYYCFGNYDFARSSIQLLGQSYNPTDGFLELCAPAEVGVNIPSFSLAWILMVDDYLLFSGDRNFAKSQLPMVDKLLKNTERNSSGSIVATPRGARMWNFYEWAPGLDGAGVGGNTGLDPERIEAPLNLFYLLALDAAARITDETGGDGTSYRNSAAKLRQVFAETFWDAKAKAFRTSVNDTAAPHYAELTQALAIIANVVPPAELDALRKRLASDNNGLVPCTISHTLYKFEALLTDKAFAPRVFELIARDWGYMLGKGATSFWETIDGASAFGDAGSLCHGWSGIPAWFHGAYVLGIKPTSPGFESYEIDPVNNVFSNASGLIPTPGKPLEVKWHLEGNSVVHDVNNTGKVERQKN